jgi:hypothetical protein
LKSGERRCLTDTAWALLALIALAVPAAVVGHSQRDLTHLGFAHAPPTLSQTVAILHTNVAHAWAPVLVMAVLVQARRELRSRTWRRAVVGFFDLLVVAVVFYTVALPTGQLLGAYGWRALRSMLPAGPLELLAYALAASVYMHSRRTPIRHQEQVRYFARVAAVSAAALVAAALLETFL